MMNLQDGEFSDLTDESRRWLDVADEDEWQSFLDTIDFHVENLRPIIRQALRNDNTAELSGIPAFCLLALKEALLKGLRNIDEMVNHIHEWNNPEEWQATRCMICGMNGDA